MKQVTKEKIKNCIGKAAMYGGPAAAAGAGLCAVAGIIDSSFAEYCAIGASVTSLAGGLGRVAWLHEAIYVKPEEIKEYGLEQNDFWMGPNEDGSYCIRRLDIPVLLNRKSLLP